MTRRLVLTADDLGREAGTSVEIARLAADGAITASTVIVVAPDAEAAATAVARPGIVPRLHATLS
ncbi:MAG: ChbG/HpnK family deacetylase, partial [Agromyces sp.]